MPQSRVALAFGAVFFAIFAAKAHKHSNAHCHEGNDDVFVPRKCATVQEDVHNYDWHKFTRLGEYHCRVRDMSERSETERCGEGDEEGTLKVSQQKGL